MTAAKRSWPTKNGNKNAPFTHQNQTPPPGTYPTYLSAVSAVKTSGIRKCSIAHTSRRLLLCRGVPVSTTRQMVFTFSRRGGTAERLAVSVAVVVVLLTLQIISGDAVPGSQATHRKNKKKSVDTKKNSNEDDVFPPGGNGKGSRLKSHFAGRASGPLCAYATGATSGSIGWN